MVKTSRCNRAKKWHDQLQSTVTKYKISQILRPIRCRDYIYIYIITSEAKRWISRSTNRASIVNDRCANCAARFTFCHFLLMFTPTLDRVPGLRISQLSTVFRGLLPERRFHDLLHKSQQIVGICIFYYNLPKKVLMIKILPNQAN